MPLSEVVENLKLSLVRPCQTFDVHVKSPLFLVENRDVKCPLFSSESSVVTGSGTTLHGVSVASIQELPEYTIVLRHERHSHLSMLKIRGAVPPFPSGFPFAKPGSGYDLVPLCSGKTIDMHVRLFVLSVLALAQQLCNTFLKLFVYPCSYMSLAVSLNM